MAKVVLVGYGQMLYSLIKGIKETNKHEIAGVLRADRIKNSPFKLFFKDIFNPSKDYAFIKSFNLKEIKAQSVNSATFIKQVEKINPDMIIVGSWGEKFKKNILEKFMCVNFHPALLPKNRGANPYFWSIYLNQSVSGLSVHLMNEKFDCGDILLQEAITIAENETGETLKDKTTKLATAMVQDLLNLFDKKNLQPIKQNEAFASYEPQISEKEVVVDLNEPKEKVSRHLRALHPWTYPYIELKSRFIKIKKYEILDLTKEFENKNNYQILERANKYFLIKGSDFLFKVYIL